FFLLHPPPPRSTLFPYTTLFRSLDQLVIQVFHLQSQRLARLFLGVLQQRFPLLGDAREDLLLQRLPRGFEGLLFLAQSLLAPGEDRKSTRLNSSHVAISYAVFCL